MKVRVRNWNANLLDGWKIFNFALWDVSRCEITSPYTLLNIIYYSTFVGLQFYFIIKGERRKDKVPCRTLSFISVPFLSTRT